jgi:hypothetical protein
MNPHSPYLSLLLGLLLTCACGPGKGTDDSGSPENVDWSACFTKDEHMTCDDVCASEGKTCVASGCPANPDTCTPDDCAMATVTIAFNETICVDSTLGGFLDQSCDEPIGWQANSIGRCCCAD